MNIEMYTKRNREARNCLFCFLFSFFMILEKLKERKKGKQKGDTDIFTRIKKRRKEAGWGRKEHKKDEMKYIFS